MENLLTWFKNSRALHIRCPLCGATTVLGLPDRDGAPLVIVTRGCKHIIISADAIRTKIDLPNIRVQEF